MLRAQFLNTVAAFAAAPALQSSDDKSDASLQSPAQALRVLLGEGDAQRIDDHTFMYEGRRYRGTFAIRDGRVISTVGLEEYLYSVVPREMPPSWPAAALQTQAIVARTFVLERSSPQHAYDLVPSQADQVYTGMDAEHPTTSRAVDATAGQVLRFGNAFASTVYSSCCGGHTEAASDAWGGTPIPYLRGTPCTHCSDAPWYAWNKSVALDAFYAAMQTAPSPDAQITGITLDAIDASGRARYWNVDTGSQKLRVPAAKIRGALGGRVLPSLRVKSVSVDGAASAIAIDGSGFGHGVGLCQWGARGLAAKGAAAADIVAFYYPGTAIAHD